jgi:hypothetical protein
MAKQTPMFGLIKNQHIPTWGTIALAALQIALLSGVALLPFFEAGIKAFDAYSQLHNTFSLKLLQAIHHRSSDVFFNNNIFTCYRLPVGGQAKRVSLQELAQLDPAWCA